MRAVGAVYAEISAGSAVLGTRTIGHARPPHCRNEHDMTVLRIPTAGTDGLTYGDDRVHMRAHCRHQATVVTISGDVDAANSSRVHDFATRFAVVGNTLILDLSGVDFFSARGISVLIAVDDACRAAEVPWTLVPSRIVSRVLQLTACDSTVPTASSVPAALRQLTAPAGARSRLALVVTTAQRQIIDRAT
jgi:anti-anti-sigma factor